MADSDFDSCFSPLSSGESSDVENLLSQAADLHALEQITALNTCHLPDLPSHLESRFLRLKSLPAPRPIHNSTPAPAVANDADNIGSTQSSSTKEVVIPITAAALDRTHASNSPEKENHDILDSFSASPMLLTPSPPRRRRSGPWGGWFRCLSVGRCKMEETALDRDIDDDDDFGDWGKKYDDIMSGFDALSVKDQRRRLKMVMNEVEKSKREAKSIIKSISRQYK